MRLTTRGGRDEPITLGDQSPLDRIQEWTEAAEMDVDPQSIRDLAAAARDAATFPVREY